MRYEKKKQWQIHCITKFNGKKSIGWHFYDAGNIALTRHSRHSQMANVQFVISVHLLCVPLLQINCCMDTQCRLFLHFCIHFSPHIFSHFEVWMRNAQMHMMPQRIRCHRIRCSRLACESFRIVARTYTNFSYVWHYYRMIFPGSWSIAWSFGWINSISFKRLYFCFLEPNEIHKIKVNIKCWLLISNYRIESSTRSSHPAHKHRKPEPRKRSQPILDSCV